MHHPGPPRFLAVGEEIELAPRDPDPAATYAWRLAESPEGSTAEVGDDPVEHLTPDVPGTYVARLSAPDGEHDLTVRVFPGDLRREGAGAGSSGVSGVSGASGKSGVSGGSGVSGISGASEGSGSGVLDRSRSEGEGGRPRVRLEPAVEGDQAVVRAEPLPHPEGSESAEDLDVEFLLDDRDDVDPSAATRSGSELRIPLAEIPDRVRVHGVAVGEHGYSVPDAVEFTRETSAEAAEERADGAPQVRDTEVSAARLYDPPSWAEDAVIYEVYIRMFGDGDEGESGRSVFDAVVDRLDYIESLGADTLWLTPVLQNDHAPHGYNITDFFSIADDLGTRADYERLIEAAHERGIAVLFDLVCNHSARTHPHFQAAVSDPDSEYRDWYEWRTETEPETYFEWEHIANFDFTHLPVRRHLLDAIDEWAPLVDGFRIDMAWAVPDNFWREVHDRTKAADPEFLLLDETIPYIPDFQGGCFDMHFDSTTYAALRRVGNGAPAEQVLDAVDERVAIGFPPHAGFMLYAENHDEARYVVECGREAAEAALGALFTLPGAPMVYAGQEFGQRGKRDRLAWDHADEELREFVSDLSGVRRELPALDAAAAIRRVSYEVTDGDADRVVTFGRVADGDANVVVLNFGEEPAVVEVPAAAGDADAVSGASLATAEGLSVESVAVVQADPADLGASGTP